MSSMLRQFRRAPGRIVASVLALALAIGAIGVLAIPSISEGTLHEAGALDGLADIVVDTTPIDASQLERVNAIDGVSAAEAEMTVAVELDDGYLTQLVGLDFDRQTMDVVHVDAGRLPTADEEVLTSPSVGGIGTEITVAGSTFRIVGHGGTLWWSDSDMLYAPIDAVKRLGSTDGTNRLVVTAFDDDETSLRSISGDIREVLAAGGDTYSTFPIFLPDDSTPVDADIEQVSTLIGLLGVFAGLVALVLLASTANTLVSERTREVAVMRALGGGSRRLRRRLRRIALGITGVALLIGLPLGIVISNVIARMVLEEFVGITPDIAVDWTVLAASTFGMLLGARLVASGAARRVVNLPLAEALRDREGAPFGGRAVHRLSIRVPSGGLFGRLALRSTVHRPTRALTVVVQIAAAVGAAFLVPSLITSVNAYNSAVQDPWSWASVTVARDPGLPIHDSMVGSGDEAAIWVTGEIAGREVDVFGLDPETAMFDPRLRAGSWLADPGRDAVLSAGFAARNSIGIGDTVVLELASGTVTYEVTGVSDDFAGAIYIDRRVLAADLGVPDRANAIWSTDAAISLPSGVATRTTTAVDLAADDQAGRDAIVLIFGAIGVIVAGVAALAVLSSMTVSLYERRHEFAAMQAIGARRRRLRRLILRELMPVAVVGVAGGLALGAVGTRSIIASFEASNSIDIGVVDAVGAIPVILAGTLVSLVVLAAAIVRATSRRPIAVTLRGVA